MDQDDQERERWGDRDDAAERCIECLLRSIRERREAEAKDPRVTKPTVYPIEFYWITAARFYALATRAER